MIRFRSFFFLSLWIVVAVASAQPVFQARDGGETRDRTYDVLHYRIEVAVDEMRERVDGRVSITVVPLRSALRELTIDAEEMSVSGVTTAGGKALPYVQTEKSVLVRLDTAYSWRDTLALTLSYSCTPRRGMYFVRPDSSFPGAPWQFWTQGEDMDNHFWFPCYDYPNDVATSEMIATVNSRFNAVSNGRLVDVRENRSNGTRTYHWRTDQPHVSYLIMLAGGDYEVLRDTVDTIPLEYYVYPNEVGDARACFRETPAMMRFFSDYTGFAYPWGKYAQVLCHDFVVGGMENVSATTLADESTVYDARARIDASPTSLIAHELAHQWWGDIVTCKDWRHLWLNESFASYFDPLYHEHSLGRDEFDLQMFEAQEKGIAVDRRLGRKPIVSVESYGDNLYPRGAAVLHMLRFVLGDSLFRRSLHHYLTVNRFSPVETCDLRQAIEEAAGRDLTWFFDQWVMKAGYPVFEISSRWDDEAKTVRLSVRQVQTMDSLTGVFRTPVDIELWTSTGRYTHRIEVHSPDMNVGLHADEKPRLVQFDPGNWILKEIRFQKSTEEWRIQALEAWNPVQRIRAIRKLKEMAHDGDDPLAELAVRDPCREVRAEAVTALGEMLSLQAGDEEKIRYALLDATRDREPSVRAVALKHLVAGTPEPEVLSAVRRMVQDSSARVVSAALRTLSVLDPEGSTDMLSRFLGMPSAGDRIAIAAMNGLMVTDSVLGRAAALEKAQPGSPVGLRRHALTLLARHCPEDSVAQHLLITAALERNRSLRAAAIRLLGNTGRGAGLRTLESIAADPLRLDAAEAERQAARIRNRLNHTSGGSGNK